ncbi:hypothetical protein C5469_12040 [Photorhabdus cinerea]|uniref:Uncharacterized protein n=1 Tax=Photorhabdus cinerea TaxID=471575 RepID=A0A7X5QEE2_9GAMM|nr:hypothetical protein [Photorhabdus cinerea]
MEALRRKRVNKGYLRITLTHNSLTQDVVHKVGLFIRPAALTHDRKGIATFLCIRVLKNTVKLTIRTIIQQVKQISYKFF